MALCTIPIQVKKVGGDLKYTPSGKSDGIIYAATIKDLAKNHNVDLISNESLYREINLLFNIFDDKKPAIALSSSGTPIWYTFAGDLNNYCSKVSKETLSEKEEIPTIMGRVNPEDAIEDLRTLQRSKKIAHFQMHLGSVGAIAQISNAEPHQYSIGGELSEFLSCPECSQDETYKSGLYLNVRLSNLVPDQESKLEEDAQELLELLQKNGYALVGSKI